MRVFDENDTEILSPDLSKGYLKKDSLLIMRHEAVKGVKEVGHYETVAEYPNGGKDVQWVVDVPGVEARDAWDEYEDILRYVPYTEIELKIQEIERNRRPLTTVEALELLLAQQINTLTVDDKTALRLKSFYPEWASGVNYPEGFKVRYGDKLWKVRDGQAHTSLANWDPKNVPALWEQINETNAGTIDDPIPYDGSMSLVKGRYYYQDGGLYLCERDTGVAVYHSLSELIGLYVKKVE